MSATVPNPLASLAGPLYGSFYIGTVMSTAFYGVTCMQTFYYYVHYENDSLRTKILVAILWALDTIHEALSIAGAYKYIIAGLINPLSFTTDNPELVLLYLLTALVALPTQGFFVYRIYIVSKRNIIAPLIWVLLALTQLVGATVYICKALYTVNGHVQVVEISVLNGGIFVTLGILCLSVAAGVDVLIAIFMTWLLIRERATTGVRRTAHILQLLTIFAVNTGVWTATFALMTIILLHVFPSKVYYAVFIIPLGSIYCNTLLANLNVRSYVRGRSSYNTGLDFFTSTVPAVPERSLSDRRIGETKLVSSAHETPEVIKFPGSDLSTPAISENV